MSMTLAEFEEARVQLQQDAKEAVEAVVDYERNGLRAHLEAVEDYGKKIVKLGRELLDWNK